MNTKKSLPLVMSLFLILLLSLSPVSAQATTARTPTAAQLVQPTVVPRITFGGKAAVGKSVKAKVEVQAPKDLELAQEEFEWKVGTKTVGRGTSYVPTKKDSGKRLTLVYTLTWKEDSKYAAGTITSTRNTVPVRTAATVDVSVTVSGTAKVGQQLTATGKSVLPKGIGKTSASYSWYRAGKKVGSGSKYTVRTADRGKKLKVKYQLGWKQTDQYIAGSKTATTLTKKVAKLKPKISVKVSISGSPKVGKKLVAAGTSTFPRGTKRSSGKFTWYVDGEQVATGKSYRLKTKDAGKKVKVTYRVKSNATSKYTSGSKTASSARTVKAARYNCGFTGASYVAPKVGDERTYCIQLDREQSAPDKKLDRKIKDKSAATVASAGGKTTNRVRFANPFNFQAPVTSEFGWRLHPILGYNKLHDGTDFAANCGTSQRTTKSGSVFATGNNLVSGKYVVINHGKINGKAWLTKHAHLQTISVKKGQKVTRKSVIGYTGTTGRSTGCHLHLTLYRNGEKVNVLNYM